MSPGDPSATGAADMEPLGQLHGRVTAVAFDLDGTIYFGEMLADGASEVVDLLAERGVRVFFFTNNSAKTRADVIDKLVRLGMPADVSNTYTSGSATGAYLLERGWGRVAVIGTEGLRSELASAGVEIDDDGSAASALVVGLVPGFDFDARPDVLDSLPVDCPIIACNLDMMYPVEDGVRKPGCGAIVRAVEAWCGRRSEAVVGKPGTYMLEVLCAEHNLVPAEVLVVGDNYDSDIAMARAAGAPAVLVDNDGSAAGVRGAEVVGGLRALRAMLAAALPAKGVSP